ncbi:orotate phosphoribosyltransferase [Hydrogenophaga sp.]|uniref:orotate phosphoribosyltransferase n=1 Tax=Hydrogenophaga sp. TaxID=1904254 RepID=UPI002FC60A80
MMPNPSSAQAVAELLIEAGCVSCRTDEPFRLPSGWASPVYMDCRRLISFPQTRQLLLEQALARLRAAGAVDGLAAVAGGESSGIAFAAWMADALNLPLQYVRKRAVGQAQVEGVVTPGSAVLLVDDLMAAGLSKLTFCEALRARGAEVRDVFVVFDYGTFHAAAMLHSHKVRVHALCTWQDVLDVARERTGFDPSALAEWSAFLRNPTAWSEAHGGIASSPVSRVLA